MPRPKRHLAIRFLFSPRGFRFRSSACSGTTASRSIKILESSRIRVAFRGAASLSIYLSLLASDRVSLSASLATVTITRSGGGGIRIHHSRQLSGTSAIFHIECVCMWKGKLIPVEWGEGSVDTSHWASRKFDAISRVLSRGEGWGCPCVVRYMVLNSSLWVIVKVFLAMRMCIFSFVALK